MDVVADLPPLARLGVHGAGAPVRLCAGPLYLEELPAEEHRVRDALRLAVDELLEQLLVKVVVVKDLGVNLVILGRILFLNTLLVAPFRLGFSEKINGSLICRTRSAAILAKVRLAIGYVCSALCKKDLLKMKMFDTATVGLSLFGFRDTFAESW